MNRAEWDALTADERRSVATPGTRCVVAGCSEPAGTPWGPLWCAAHDDERIAGVLQSLEALTAPATGEPK